MNNTKLNHRLTPQQVIVVYSDKYKSNFYLEQREIKSIGGKNVIMAPVPMPDETLKNVAKVYVKQKASEMEFAGLMDSRFLYAQNKIGTTTVMWYRPAMTRNLNFSEKLNIKGASSVSIPAILYVVINNNLYVYALMNDDRPGLKTKLYNAPFFNIYGDGRVCLGSAHIGTRSSTYDGEAERYERGFYMAEQNGGQSEHSCKTNLRQLWRRQIKLKAPFPCKDELTEHKQYKTLNDIFIKIIGNNQYDDE